MWKVLRSLEFEEISAINNDHQDISESRRTRSWRELSITQRNFGAPFKLTRAKLSELDCQ